MTERWDDGGRAWERLAGRARGTGLDPLAALADVGVVRRLLDEAELDAVRAARRHGSSWAEIAVKLGVTRQSAWERWRDLDEEPAREAEAALDRAARTARRRAGVVVPDVVGRTVEDASAVLAGCGLVAMAADPTVDLGAQAAIVTDQSPEAGARAQPGAPVRLWTDRGGGAGVREPRRPKPQPRTARGMLEEPSGRAVG